MVARRPPYPGAPFRLSELIISVPLPLAPAEAPPTVDALRRARSAGITTFDIVEGPDPATAEALLARAFPQGDPEIVVLSRPSLPGGPPVRWSPEAGSASPRPTLSSPATGRTTADGPRFDRIAEVESGGGGSTPAAGSRGTETEERSATLAVVSRCRTLEEVRGAALGGGECLVSGSFSLLDHDVPLAALAEIGEDRLHWVARDPFAGGRLDGRRFAPAALGRRPAPPAAVRELEADFAPVVRLAFLARTGHRSLAQAALRFLLDRPWVAGACIPLPPAERWMEILGFRSSPALEDGERIRAEGIPGGMLGRMDAPDRSR